MAILKIARMGHPVLRRRADEVKDPTDPRVHALIRDMIETMQDADGAGLAAPQVHFPLRVVIFHLPEDDAGDAGDSAADSLTVLINPVIEPLTEDMELGWEGCLSVPGLIGAVPRYTRIRYAGLSPQGERLERTAEDFHARVVQHECDHLDGILYPMRMTDLGKFGFVEEMRRAYDNEEDEAGMAEAEVA